MSIVLKTDPKEIAKRERIERNGHIVGYRPDPIRHDLLWVHAMQMAIEELYAESKGSYKEPAFTRDAIYKRAAANLARLIAGDSTNTPDSVRNGEGNG
jgi:hypothetical protein